MQQAGLFDPALQQFNITAGVKTSWISLPPITLAREFTVSLWALMLSATGGGSPRFFRFSSQASPLVVDVAASNNGYWRVPALREDGQTHSVCVWRLHRCFLPGDMLPSGRPC